MKTLADYRSAGYIDSDQSYQRGYVTRKPRCDGDILVHIAGGSRKRQPYYLSPSYDSTSYCVRIYLRKEE